MSGEYPFWEKELKTISSLVCGITPDCPICVTGVPSYERRFAVENVLKAKGFDYLLYSCNSRSTLRDILATVCKFLSSLLSVPFVMKSSGELLLDIQEYSKQYSLCSNKTKSVYVIVDSCELLDDDIFDLISLLPNKVPALGVILLTVSVDPFKPNTSFLIHLPILSDKELATVLKQDVAVDSALADIVIKQILIYFSTQTNSLSELRTLRDMTLAFCTTHKINTKDELSIRNHISSLRESLFVNILPIYSEQMSSIRDQTGQIPITDFCGVDISLNAKVLLIAGYLCSVYPESEDKHLFGREEELTIKTKSRRRRKVTHIAPSLKSSYFSINRLVALYLCLKQTLFPEMQSSSSNYGLLLSQINTLTRLGLLTQVGGNNHTVELNQLLFRCCVKKGSILNIAKNINFDISPYV